MGAGIVFALEYFDPSFHTPAEVEAFFNRPVLAAVPDQGGVPYQVYGGSALGPAFQAPEPE